mgnify:CR=1 FL=1
MKEKTTFRIGELAKLFDIGVDSIRYYEEVGILRPKRDPINNYRLYTIEDVRKLTMIRELLGLNLTTEQIRDFDANRNIHNTISLLEQELHMVNESLLKLYETKNSIQARLESFTRAMSAKHFDMIQLLELDKRACVMINDGNLPDVPDKKRLIRSEPVTAIRLILPAVTLTPNIIARKTCFSILI